MEMHHVESSNIDSIGYDEDEGTLRILFINGHMYEYYDVPQYVFDDLFGADSKGKYAHQHIYKNYSQQRIQ